MATALLAALAAAGSALGTAASTAGTAIGTAASSIGSGIGQIAGTVGQGIGNAAQGIGNAVQGIGEGFGGLVQGGGGGVAATPGGGSSFMTGLAQPASSAPMSISSAAPLTAPTITAPAVAGPAPAISGSGGFGGASQAVGPSLGQGLSPAEMGQSFNVPDTGTSVGPEFTDPNTIQMNQVGQNMQQQQDPGFFANIWENYLTDPDFLYSQAYSMMQGMGGNGEDAQPAINQAMGITPAAPSPQRVLPWQPPVEDWSYFS